MLDTIIVGAIILAAAGYAIYRLFMRPSCGCDCDGCSSSPPRHPKTNGSTTCSGNGTGGCSCGK